MGVCGILMTCRCAALKQWPVGGSPDVLQSLSRVDLQRRDASPSVREGDPAGAPASPGCNGRPVTGSHSQLRQEECSCRFPQQGNLFHHGEVSTGPFSQNAGGMQFKMRNSILSKHRHVHCCTKFPFGVLHEVSAPQILNHIFGSC